MKRFRAEGDFLLRALVNLISFNRSHIHQMERDFTDFEKLAEPTRTASRDPPGALFR
jgi:hypothetical protein